MQNSNFDIIVVGGGHAGVEAAAAAGRMGAKTALLTQRLSTVGAMSCNPAIGGLGKGHLVREIDALDGIMGRAADQAAIQFRVLNRRKGPAVQGPRVQADRKLYRSAVMRLLRNTDGLVLLEGECAEILRSGSSVSGVKMADGRTLRSQAVVLTTGTFLNGVIHRGAERISAGRLGDKAVQTLSHQLNSLGFTLGRLKTGTPPRLDGRTIRFEALEQQWGDDEPHYFSSLTTRTEAPQTLCHITRTNAATHAIIAQNLRHSAVYSGAISGSGPRYCPSIEDKVVRFAERESHQIFLEPEGLDSPLIYPNGISTSLPAEVQRALVQSIPGLENVEIAQPGYAIEYDYVNPTELQPNLMTKKLPGLFLAGQINGTTGYEEAAAQGLAAGIGAALHVRGASEVIFDRTNSYVGVMLDDLLARGVTEPYRMFTSRAEYRLSLRADNADERLTSAGIRIGAVSGKRKVHFEAAARQLDAARSLLRELSATSATLRLAGFLVGGDNVRRSAFSWASLPDVTLQSLARIWPEIRSIDSSLVSRLDADAKYHVYVERQQKELENQRADERLEIPADLDLNSIAGLSNEMKSRFHRSRPMTLGQASRMEGVTPAALLLLAAHARRRAKVFHVKQDETA